MEARHQLRRVLARWSRYDLIAIDCVPLAEVGAEFLFQVIAERAEKAGRGKGGKPKSRVHPLPTAIGSRLCRDPHSHSYGGGVADLKASPNAQPPKLGQFNWAKRSCQKQTLGAAGPGNDPRRTGVFHRRLSWTCPIAFCWTARNILFIRERTLFHGRGQALGFLRALNCTTALRLTRWNAGRAGDNF